MSTYLLTYLGPAQRARVDLQDLLKRFPEAYFIEKSVSEFEVRADYAFGQQIVAYGDWRASPIRVAA